MGFSNKAAVSYARMTASAVDEQSIDPAQTVKGTMTLHNHFADLRNTSG